MQSRFIEFIKDVPTVTIAIPVENDFPQMCHLPFIRDESSNFYILTSSLASHFQALDQAKRACMMFVNPQEHPKSGHFAHERFKVQALISKLDKECEDYSYLIEGFKNRFGKIVNLISSLGDFYIFKFEAIEGIYIQGFGAAYKLANGQNLPMEHIRA